jgi:uncharacterized cupin superfamily protein
MTIRVSKNRIVLESIPMNESKGSNIASAATTNISAATGNYVHITGTTTITSFGTAAQAGISRTLIFDGILTLTHGASTIVLPSGANITTTAGDIATFIADTTTLWNCVSYTRADGTSLVGAGGQTTSFSVAQTTHGLSVGNAIKSTGANTYGKAQSNSVANSEVVGIVTVVTDANNFTFVSGGIITTGVPAQAAGTVMFLDPTTAGALTVTEPTTVGQVSKPVLIVLENAAKALVQNFRGLEIVDIANTDNITVQIVTIGNALSTDLSYSGMVESGTVGEAVAFGDVLYLKFSDGKWWKAKADAYATTPAQRMALASISANASGTLLIEGNVRNDTWALAANKVYLSAATAGAMTTTQPSTTGNQIQTLGTAKTSTTLHFKPSLDVGEK